MKLTLSFTYTFKTEKSSWDIFLDNLGSILHKIFTKKEEKKEEAKDEKPEDAVKCKVAIGIAYQTHDAAQQQGMKLTMK